LPGRDDLISSSGIHCYFGPHLKILAFYFLKGEKPEENLKETIHTISKIPMNKTVTRKKEKRDRRKITWSFHLFSNACKLQKQG